MRLKTMVSIKLISEGGEGKRAMWKCDQCDYRMLTKGLRYASNGVREVSVDVCAECGKPLEDVPSGYELEDWMPA